MGPTFSWIIGQQFKKLKEGDRFFFTNNVGPNAKGLPNFLNEMIGKRRLSDIICQNSEGEIQELQEKALLMPNQNNNPLSKCKDRPDLDFQRIVSEWFEPEMFLEQTPLDVQLVKSN